MHRRQSEAAGSGAGVLCQACATTAAGCRMHPLPILQLIWLRLEASSQMRSIRRSWTCSINRPVAPGRWMGVSPKESANGGA